MEKTTAAKLERVTITIPQKLVSQIETRMDEGGYASLSEWIRFAIREQLEREAITADEFFAGDELARQAWESSRTSQGKPYDMSRWKKRLGG